jgi:hypothetical protein
VCSSCSGGFWEGDTFVDYESGLNTAANRLRLKLGDSAESPRYIELELAVPQQLQGAAQCGKGYGRGSTIREQGRNRPRRR